MEERAEEREETQGREELEREKELKIEGAELSVRIIWEICRLDCHSMTCSESWS